MPLPFRLTGAPSLVPRSSSCAPLPFFMLEPCSTLEHPRYLPLPQPASSTQAPSWQRSRKRATRGQGRWRVCEKCEAMRSYTPCTCSASNDAAVSVALLPVFVLATPVCASVSMLGVATSSTMTARRRAAQLAAQRHIPTAVKLNLSSKGIRSYQSTCLLQALRCLLVVGADPARQPRPHLDAAWLFTRSPDLAETLILHTAIREPATTSRKF